MAHTEEDRLRTTTSVVYVDHPDWVHELVDRAAVYRDDVAKMRLAIAVARANVVHGTGGALRGAVFLRENGGVGGVGGKRGGRPHTFTPPRGGGGVVVG